LSSNRVFYRVLVLSMAPIAWIATPEKPAYAARNNPFAAALESITEDDLYRHVEVLADDVYEGRAAGSRGGRAAARYLLEELEPEGMTPAGDNGGYLQAFNNDCRNILALLPGDDPRLNQEVVIVGAHYDHLGRGKGSPDGGSVGPIYNGADDNASGTAVLLDEIQAFSQSHLKMRRSILFVFWDSEERGLVGSKYWIAHPTLPLDRVKLNITIGMVGRLRDERLLVLGSRSGYGLRRLFADSAKDSLWLDFSWDISANSDHWPFLESGIPVALIHTGLHADYHRSTDDPEKIDRAGMREVGRYMFAAIVKAANEDQLPKFREAVKLDNDKLRRATEEPLPPASIATWPARPAPPRLGITWREDEAELGSVFLTRVIEGSPAAAADLQVGDRIYELNGRSFAHGLSLHAIILSLLDAGHTDFNLLTERRGKLRTINVKLASEGQARQDENREPAIPAR
jgi:Peptidase family M28/PDZ domain